MNTKIDLDSSEYWNLRREILRKVGFVKPLNQASENEADIIYAEEYKKASGKIDTFFKKLNDADYKLQWIGIDKLNRDQLIDLVILFIGRQSKYKDIYNNLKHPNTLFNYFGMMIGDNDLSAVLPNASPAVPLAFFLMLPMIKNVSSINCCDTIEAIKNINDRLYRTMREGYLKPLGSLVPDYCASTSSALSYLADLLDYSGMGMSSQFQDSELYVDLIETLMTISFVYIVNSAAKLNGKAENWQDTYSKLLDNMAEKSDSLYQSICMKMKNDTEEIESLNLCLLSFFGRIKRMSVFDEKSSIEKSLAEEIKTNPEKFSKYTEDFNRDSNSWLTESFDKIDDYHEEVERLIKRKNRVNDLSEKIDAVKSLIWLRSEERLFPVEYLEQLFDIDIRTGIMIFNEFFINKSKFDNILWQSDKLVKDILKNSNMFFGITNKSLLNRGKSGKDNSNRKQLKEDRENLSLYAETFNKIANNDLVRPVNKSSHGVMYLYDDDGKGHCISVEVLQIKVKT